MAKSDYQPTQLQADEDPVGFRDQSRWASTYFSYREYNLSHKFFDSEEFLGLEQRFNFLLQLDVSKCFDSIYTHSIEWSMRGKDFSKLHLPSADRKTFESAFDEVIRHANWNETHGILIGPESSRIFAEIILQAADRNIERMLEIEGIQVEIRRYVDDFYVFANVAADLDTAKRAIERALRQLNLHINESKTKASPRPFVSKISAARSRIAEVLEDLFSVAEPLIRTGTEHPTAARIDRVRSHVTKAIRRTAIELDTPYEGFVSFALSVLHNKLVDSLPAKDNPPDLTKGHLARLAWLISVVRIAQFLHSMDRRVNTSLKLARLYSTAIRLATQLQCAIAPIEGQILDGLRNSIDHKNGTAVDQIAKINHICIVDLLLKSGPRIESHDIEMFVGTKADPLVLAECTYFQLVATLFLARKRHRFLALRTAVISKIKQRLQSSGIKFKEDTESALLLTDFISCPHIDDSDKIDIVRDSLKRVTGESCTANDAAQIIRDSGWITFTDWSASSDLSKMLARKELTPAYE